MLSSRRQGREAALQVLYLTDVCRMALEDLPEAEKIFSKPVPEHEPTYRQQKERILQNMARLKRLRLEKEKAEREQ